MQADEDVGKIVLAVPVLVSKALELFLQDLCDRTYDITLTRGAKTVNSLHLKHCVQSFNVFDFLREVVNKVPDYGHSDVGVDERTMIKRKKAAADELNESDEELKRNKMNEAKQTSGNGRGRGRGRGRGKGRGRASAERGPPQMEVELESCTPPADHRLELCKSTKGEVVVDLDLNVGVDEDTEKVVDVLDGRATLQPPTPSPSQPIPARGIGGSSSVKAVELKNEEYLGLSLSEMDRMAIDTRNLAQINLRLDQEHEDYDEE